MQPHQQAERQRKAREAAVEEACEATLVSHSSVYCITQDTAVQAPSAAFAACSLKKLAEEASLLVRSTQHNQAGCVAPSEVARLASCQARETAGKTARAVALAKHAAQLGDTPFGHELARNVAYVLRRGTIIRTIAANEGDSDDQAAYNGVGLSFGGMAMMRTSACCESVTAEDEVSFSIDSHWVEWDGTQQCATAQLDIPGRHMGPRALSPQELAPQACVKLPLVLRWPSEKQFVMTLAEQSERSLALLLGSDSQGSITVHKLHAAVSSCTAHSTCPRAGSFVEDVLRQLSDARLALESLERAAASAERGAAAGGAAASGRCTAGKAGEVRPRQDYKCSKQSFARYWAEQLKVQVVDLRDDVAAVSTHGLGPAGTAARPFQDDILRNLQRLLARITAHHESCTTAEMEEDAFRIQAQTESARRAHEEQARIATALEIDRRAQEEELARVQAAVEAAEKTEAEARQRRAEEERRAAQEARMQEELRKLQAGFDMRTAAKQG